MLRLLLPLAVLLLFTTGCFNDNNRYAEIEITYLKDGVKKKSEYSCRGENCAVLNHIKWKPVLPGEICPEGYGGTDLVIIKGEINGQKVDSSFQRTNMCEIARFDSLNKLLRYNGLLGGGKEKLTASHYFQFLDLSHALAKKMPFAPITAVVIVLLLSVFLLIYLWLSSLVFSFREKRYRLPSLFLPPFAIVFYLISLFKTKQMAKIEPKLLLDSAVILATLFLPFFVTLITCIVLIFWEIRSLGKDKVGEIDEQ